MGTTPGDLAQVLIGQLDFTSIVPERYQVFRPAIQDAVEFFLLRIGEARLLEILARQAALPPEAATAQRVVALMRACPTLHKLGQVVARNRHLDPALRRNLQRLEMFDTELDPESVRILVLEELGDSAARYAIELDAAATIEASVALVIPCRWQKPGRRRAHDAVLKIIKPGLHERLAAELEILDVVADFLDERRLHYGLPAFQYRETFATVRELLHNEIDLEREQRHLLEANRFYRANRHVWVPALLPFSKPTVTAMERIRGVKVTDFVGTSPVDGVGPRRRALAATVVRALIADVVFSRKPETIFHADPHAGNLFAADDGRLAILDWSLAGRLKKTDREDLALLFLGAVALNHRRVSRAVRSLAVEVESDAALDEAAQRAVAKVRRGQIPGPTWFVELFEDLVQNGVKFPARLVLFRKSLFTLKGVVRDVDPRCSIGIVFFQSALRHLVVEWPRRYVTWFGSRDYSTHISNADLVKIYASAPFTLARYVRQSLQEARAAEPE